MSLTIAILSSSALAALISDVFNIILYRVQKADKKKDASTCILLGLEHDKIVEIGLHYINQKYVTEIQYNELIKYLWEPYEALSGNGTAKKVIDELKR